MTPFRHRFRVPFHHLDPGGVLFYGHLFAHLHEGYEAWLKAQGVGLKAILEEGHHALPLVHAEADYHHPMGLDDEIEQEIALVRLGEHSFTLEHRFWRNATLCANALTIHACVNRHDGQPAHLPKALVKALTRR